jgi:stage IV sporulation protein FB
VSSLVTAPSLGIVQPVGATGRGLGFSLAGIPVRIEPAFLVIIAILGINPVDPQPLYIASWVLIATMSVLVHELGHAVVFRVFGIRPAITLHGFGGLTSGSGALTPWREIGVSLAGPLSALVLLGLPAVWLERSGTVTSAEAQVFVSQAVWINIGWSLLNLVPVLPLDGGHVFEALAEMTAKGRGRRIAAVVSVAVAAGLGLLALRYGLLFGALLAAMFAGINLTELSRAKQAGLGAELQQAHRRLLAHDPTGAETIVRSVLDRRPSGDLLRLAAELAGWARLWQGDGAGARRAVARAAHAGGPTSWFVAAEALAAGRTEEGVSVMAWAFANEPPGPAGSLGAVATAGTGQAVAVGRELLLLGPDGEQGRRLLVELLRHTGYAGDAVAVEGLRTG